jgi:hypothetical protein
VAKKKRQKDSAKARDMQRIRDSVRDLAANPQLFLGRIDPKRRQDAVERLRAWEAMTGADLLESLAREAGQPKKTGRKVDRDTPRKILEAAKCRLAGIKPYRMARRLYPGETQTVAYGRTRPFLRDHKAVIDAVMRELQEQALSKPTG